MNIQMKIKSAKRLILGMWPTKFHFSQISQINGKSDCTKLGQRLSSMLHLSTTTLQDLLTPP